jgi:hypothetical protein
MWAAAEFLGIGCDWLLNGGFRVLTKAMLPLSTPSPHTGSGCGFVCNYIHQNGVCWPVFRMLQ